MENQQGKWDMVVLRYGGACMLVKKENYDTELINTITAFNENKKLLLSNVNIREVIMKVMREDKEEFITDANNVTADTFSHASSLQRENSNGIFTIEKLKKLNKPVNAINNLTINDSGYELNTATASDAQGNLASNPYIVIHTSSRILDQKLLSFRTIGKVSVLPPPKNPSIYTIGLAPQTLLTPSAKEIFTYATPGV